MFAFLKIKKKNSFGEHFKEICFTHLCTGMYVVQDSALQP